MALKTYSEIFTFVNAAQAWVNEHKAESKLKYALTKVLKAGMKAHEAYTEAVQDLQIEYCSVDEKGNIITDAKGAFFFTKDALRKRNAATRVLVVTSVEITPFLVQGAPSDLTESERDAFAGFVLPEREDESRLELVKGDTG